MSAFLKIDLLRNFLAAVVYLSEAPSSPGFLFGVVKQFYRSDPLPPPPPCTLFKYIGTPVLIHTGKGLKGGGGGGELMRRLEGR
jgi:hypothetical protein